MTRVFSQEEQLRAMMRFEWALMCALEKHGIAEAGSSEVMESLADAILAGFVHAESIEREAKDAGNVAIPFVRQLTAKVKARSESAARAVHLGATSQDVLDSVLVLQIRDGVKLLDEAIEELDRALVIQVRAHRHTMLLGRTWLQPGPPTTLGLKLAGTLAALRRRSGSYPFRSQTGAGARIRGRGGHAGRAGNGWGRGFGRVGAHSRSAGARVALAHAAGQPCRDGAGARDSDWNPWEIRKGHCPPDADGSW